MNNASLVDELDSSSNLHGPAQSLRPVDLVVSVVGPQSKVGSKL